MRIMGYCARGGHKVRRERLVSDPEHLGMLMDRSWVDEPHPQKHLKPIGPDRSQRRRSAPEVWNEGSRVVYGLTGSLYEAYAPFALTIQIGAFLVDPPDGDGYGMGDYGEGTYGS